jgi:hypothetical protein
LEIQKEMENNGRIIHKTKHNNNGNQIDEQKKETKETEHISKSI